MASASAIIDEALAQFDVTRVQALSYLNERYRRMVADARWIPSGTAGSTVDDVYTPTALTDVTGAAGVPAIPTDLHDYLRDGVIADLHLFTDERTDMAAIHEGRFQEGVVKLRERRITSGGTTTAAAILDQYTQHFNDSRARGLQFLNERYRQIVARARWYPSGTTSTTVTDVYSPTALTDATTSGGVPVIPEDLRYALRDGVFADGFKYVEKDAKKAEPYERSFQEAAGLLRERRTSSGDSFSAQGLIDYYVQAFNDSRANALALLNARYQRMVVEAQWLQKEGSIGTTVADQAEYAVASGIEDIRSVYIGGERYFPVSMEDMAALEDDESGFTSSYPAFSEQYDSSGALYIRLYPAPDTSGDTITALTSGQPTALTDSTLTAGQPSIPQDLWVYLRHGLTADGYLFSGKNPAQSQGYEQQYERGIELLRRRKNSRFGSTATVMQVSSGGY